MTAWSRSTTKNTKMRCPILATRSWLKIAHQNSNSWFCWSETKLQNRTRLMSRLKTCKTQPAFLFQLQRMKGQNRSLMIYQMFFNRDIDIYLRDNATVVKVNSVEILSANMPYQHSTGFCFLLLKWNVDLPMLRPKHHILMTRFLIIFRQYTDQREGWGCFSACT